MDFKKVLTVCSAGLLRSPTAAHILSAEPYNYNTRSVGMEESFALIPFDEAVFEWADEIVFMTSGHYRQAVAKYGEEFIESKATVILGIEDDYAYRDPQLIELIKERYNAYLEDGEQGDDDVHV
jgi:predicted protein tyrosine phosphatase